MEEIEVRRLTPEQLWDFLEFFDDRAFEDNPEWAGCYCFFPYLDPERDGAWRDRTSEQNRASMSAAIEAGAVGGFLAYAGDSVVGWCNAAPRSAFPAFRNLPGNGDTTAATPCFLVDPEWRGKGSRRSCSERPVIFFARTG